MSPASRNIAAPASASTNPRNTLRLLTLCAVILVILFKHPGANDPHEQPVLAHAEQVSSTEID